MDFSRLRIRRDCKKIWLELYKQGSKVENAKTRQTWLARAMPSFNAPNTSVRERTVDSRPERTLVQSFTSTGSSRVNTESLGSSRLAQQSGFLPHASGSSPGQTRDQDGPTPTVVAADPSVGARPSRSLVWSGDDPLAWGRNRFHWARRLDPSDSVFTLDDPTEVKD